MVEIRKFLTISAIASVLLAALLGAGGCSAVFPFDLPETSPPQDAGPDPRCDGYAGVLNFVGVNVNFGGMTGVDGVVLRNGGSLNLPMDEARLCTARGGCEVIGGTLAVGASRLFFFEVRDLLRSSGEVALSRNTNGTLVCDYIRWNDGMTVDGSDLGASAGGAWDSPGEYVDSASLSATNGFQRVDSANAPSAWRVAPIPMMMP